MKYWLLVALLLVSCGQKHKAKETTSPTEELEAKYSLYHNLAYRGWQVEDECDALLFVSLQHVGLVEPGPVEEAQSEPGHWFRLPGPDYAAKCDSDISRDMLLGLMTYMWKFNRLDLAEDLWDYGSSHGWKMGEERKDFETRTVMTPSLIGLLADMIHVMGGTDHPERFIFAVYDTSPGFVSHLTLLHINLLGQMHGLLGPAELGALQNIRVHMSTNPLVHALVHRYTDGDQTEATRLLLTVWPNDRLPTTADWCGHWRNQCSEGESCLVPCPEERTHAGGDFLFAAAIVLNR